MASKVHLRWAAALLVVSCLAALFLGTVAGRRFSHPPPRGIGTPAIRSGSERPFHGPGPGRGLGRGSASVFLAHPQRQPLRGQDQPGFCFLWLVHRGEVAGRIPRTRGDG